jgi:hypothetical protein
VISAARLTADYRKCGRVVCHACSPHRITIPHQYIVRPPGAPRPLAQGASLSLLDSQGWYPEFGGGERVRLCNPCVPDPNIAPPHAHGGQARSPSTLNSPVQADNMQPPNIWSFYFGGGAVNDTQTRTRSATMVCSIPPPFREIVANLRPATGTLVFSASSPSSPR